VCGLILGRMWSDIGSSLSLSVCGLILSECECVVNVEFESEPVWSSRNQ
jgi:hypothetical protein